MRAIVLALVVTGCAGSLSMVTPYQQMSSNGGVGERKAAPGVWWVYARGNGYTSEATLWSYVQRRSIDLCVSEGFPHAFVQLAKDDVSRQSTGSTFTTNYDRGQSITTEDPGYTIQKHTLTARAVCATFDEYVKMQSDARSKALAGQ